MEAAIPPLIELLNSKEWEVLARATSALVKLADNSEQDPL
jgi:HEAT repeat protein